MGGGENDDATKVLNDQDLTTTGDVKQPTAEGEQPTRRTQTRRT